MTKGRMTFSQTVQDMGGWDMAKNSNEKLKGITILFQLASISVLIMNAKLLGETLYHCLGQFMGWYEYLIFFAVGLSALETINNWASIHQYIEYYDRVGLFAVDILTLGLLFEQAYVLTKMVEENSAICITTRVKYLLVTYIGLYILYLIWNCMISKNEKVPPNKKQEIMEVSRWRVAQIVFGILAAGTLMILERGGWMNAADMWENLWIWITGVYLFWALLILFLSQKLLDVLRIAMEAVHTA